MALQSTRESPNIKIQNWLNPWLLCCIAKVLLQNFPFKPWSKFKLRNKWQTTSSSHFLVQSLLFSLTGGRKVFSSSVMRRQRFKSHAVSLVGWALTGVNSSIPWSVPWAWQRATSCDSSWVRSLRSRTIPFSARVITRFPNGRAYKELFQFK